MLVHHKGFHSKVMKLACHNISTTYKFECFVSGLGLVARACIESLSVLHKLAEKKLKIVSQHGKGLRKRPQRSWQTDTHLVSLLDGNKEGETTRDEGHTLSHDESPKERDKFRCEMKLI